MSVLVEENEIVVPGQMIAEGDYKAGDGIIQEDDKYYSMLVGVMFVRGDRIFVRPLKGRYYPSVGDIVIGYIKDVSLTSWVVNLGSSYDGLLLASNATRRRFDPVRDDARRIFNEGDVVKAEIVSFNRTRDPQLATKYQGLGKLREGRVIETNPNHMARIIGKKGSMISMIKKLTNSKIMVGKNGRVWVKADDPRDEERVIEAIQQISREAHVSGLTDRISSLLRGENDE